MDRLLHSAQRLEQLPAVVRFALRIVQARDSGLKKAQATRQIDQVKFVRRPVVPRESEPEALASSQTAAQEA